MGTRSVMRRVPIEVVGLRGRGCLSHLRRSWAGPTLKIDIRPVVEERASAALAEVAALVEVSIYCLDPREQPSTLVYGHGVNRRDVRQREKLHAVRLDL